LACSHSPAASSACDAHEPHSETISEWFTGIQQSVIERRVTVSARNYVGHLSTISAYLVLPALEREQVFSQIMQVVPDRVEMVADITVHLARRSYVD
jgi:hypothetical protein